MSGIIKWKGLIFWQFSTHTPYKWFPLALWIVTSKPPRRNSYITLLDHFVFSFSLHIFLLPESVRHDPGVVCSLLLAWRCCMHIATIVLSLPLITERQENSGAHSMEQVILRSLHLPMKDLNWRTYDVCLIWNWLYVPT